MTDKPQAKQGKMLDADYAKALENLLDVCHASQRLGIRDDYPGVGHAIRLALDARERARGQ